MAQDKANKKAERNRRNNSGTNTDRQAQVARGGKDDSNKRNKLRRNMKKCGKLKKGEDAGHKKSLKSGGSSECANGRSESKKSNRSAGGKSGNKKGKAAGGRKSSRKGVKNK